MNYVITAVLFALVQGSIAQKGTKIQEQQNFRLDITKATIETYPEGNVFLTPNTVLSTMVQACAVSAGNTKNEIEKAIGSCLLDEKSLSGQLANLRSYHTNATFFVDKRINPKGNYHPIDFEDANAVNEVNQWISLYSGSRIPNFYDGSFEPTIGALPVSADTFESFWKYPFPQNANTKGPFHIGQNSVEVEYMENDKIILYYASKKFQSIGIPYEKEGVHMYILLPLGDETIASLSDRLERKDYNDLFQNARLTQVRYKVPKLKFKSTENLKNALNILGVVRSFMAGIANFSGLTDAIISIKNIVYKSTVNFYESGTDASGATAVEMVTSNISSPAPPTTPHVVSNALGLNSLPPTQDVVVDRPFLFVIYDRTVSAWLMSGAIHSPKLINNIK